MQVQFKYFLFYVVLITSFTVIACSDDGNPTTTLEELSSSVALSSESKKEQSSSSYYKENWDYLNPEIDYGEMKDERDGQIYKIVKIGTQTWMAENLNFDVDNSFCYNDSMKYCNKYGRLYPWGVAMDSVGKFSSGGKGCGVGTFCSPTFPVRGVCPKGWHLPSYVEWERLFKVEPGAGNVFALRAKNGWEKNRNGYDTYGFSALPAGELSSGFYGGDAYFWSSSEYEVDGEYSGKWLAYSVQSNESDYFLDYNRSKDEGFSVRCVKD